MELTEIANMLQLECPEKVIVDLNEYESEEHQTYKYLYEQLSQKYSEKMNELGMLVSERQSFEKENAELTHQVEILKTQIDSMNRSTVNSLEVIKQYVQQGIIVSNIKAHPIEKEQSDLNPETFYSNISEVPGVYGGTRPSWFTSLQNELSKENIKKKNVNNTITTLKDKLYFWKKEKTKDVNQAALDYERYRYSNVLELVQSDCSNEEKYLKYFLLTPGIDKEFLKTLQGASELNLNANLIIALLEQPGDQFNREVIELYISEVHKGTEYNLKQELAEELVNGTWYITTLINGVSTKMQLVPINEIEEIKNRLDEISKCINAFAANGEACAKLAQTSPDIFQNDNCANLAQNDIPENRNSSLIEFDDSMLDQY